MWSGQRSLGRSLLGLNGRSRALFDSLLALSVCTQFNFCLLQLVWHLLLL